MIPFIRRNIHDVENSRDEHYIWCDFTAVTIEAKNGDRRDSSELQ